MQTRFDPFAFGGIESALEVGEDAFEPGAGAFVALLIRAEHEDVADLFGDVFVGRAIADTEVFAELAEDTAVEDVHPLAVFSPGFDGAGFEGQRFVGDDELGIEFGAGAQAMAVGAGAVGGVEAEEARFEFGEADVGMDGAGEFFAEEVVCPFAAAGNGDDH